MTDRSHTLDAAYYQRLHDEHRAFRENNWLLAEAELVRQLPGQRLIEFGCGNGRFLEVAAAKWQSVIGVDWARSPNLDEVLQRCPNVSFMQQDALTGDLPPAGDVVCSADFLEHLPPAQMPTALRRLLGCAPLQFHKIACYDDGHSHLSIWPPEVWLAQWHAVPGGESMRIVHQVLRKGQADKIVLTVTNGPLPRDGD